MESSTMMLDYFGHIHSLRSLEFSSARYVLFKTCANGDNKAAYCVH